MNYISEIFERANIQQLREFLLNGDELLKTSNASYEKRIDEGLENALKTIRAKSPTEKARKQKTT